MADTRPGGLLKLLKLYCMFLLLWLFPLGACLVGQEAEVPRVIEVVSDVPGKPNEAGLGDRLTVTVQNLPTLLQQVGGNCRSIVLFLGGMPVTGSSAERCDPDNGHVGFFLERKEEADRTWSALLGQPTSFKRPVRVTVGSSDTRSYPTEIEPGKTQFYLIILRRAELLVFLCMLASTLIPFVLLASRSSLVRDPGPEPVQQRPYSLGRCQLAFWSLLVVEAYLFVWVVNHNLDTITDSVLALIGMGSGTALGARLIDSGKESSAPGHQPSRGFLTDILSDQSGVSIQRFQMFAWTLILGVIFCASVYKTLEMPDFSPSLLALMGISSGTYLAFKFPERDSSLAVREGLVSSQKQE